MIPEELSRHLVEKLVDGETGISSIDEGLFYRGYSIFELVEQSSFLETAFLIVKGDL